MDDPISAIVDRLRPECEFPKLLVDSLWEVRASFQREKNETTSGTCPVAETIVGRDDLLHAVMARFDACMGHTKLPGHANSYGTREAARLLILSAGKGLLSRPCSRERAAELLGALAREGDHRTLADLVGVLPQVVELQQAVHFE